MVPWLLTNSAAIEPVCAATTFISNLRRKYLPVSTEKCQLGFPLQTTQTTSPMRIVRLECAGPLFANVLTAVRPTLPCLATTADPIRPLD